MVKRVLLIAYHFPPIRHSSGIQRTLNFANYLRGHGWSPIVLTVHPRAYIETGPDQLGDIPDNVPVHRAFALDTKRHLSVFGRYPRFLARPDRFMGWIPGGIWRGWDIIRRYQPSVIFSTYPVATAHLIGGVLARLSGLPWVTEFRDPMTDEGVPCDPVIWRDYRRIESKAINRSSATVFTTPGACRLYAERYPEVPPGRWHVIPNGFDEASFQAAEAELPAPSSGGPVRLLHAGVLYPSERDPEPFFEAVARLKARGRIDAGRLQIILRATAHDHLYGHRLQELGIEDVVRLEAGVGYREALAEMLSVDGLLLFQSAACNHQIPAKVYEYFRAGRPIFAMTDAAGDTAATLREAGIDTLAPLDDATAIERELEGFLEALAEGRAPRAKPEVRDSYSREAGAAQLAGILDAATGKGPQTNS